MQSWNNYFLSSFKLSISLAVKHILYFILILLYFRVY